MIDKYTSFGDLASGEKEDQDFSVTVRYGTSGICIIAPHAGMIELHTSAIASAIAGGDHGLYLLEGRKPSRNCDLHITSERFDEPRCVGLVTGSRLAVGVHGAAGGEDFVIVGGSNDQAKKLVLDTLGLFGATDSGKPHLLGRSAANICNRATEGGVQLEISRSLREKLGAKNNSGESPLLTQFKDRIRQALRRY